MNDALIADWYAVLLCEALSAIGGLQEGAITGYLPQFLTKLQKLTQITDESHTKTKVT